MSFSLPPLLLLLFPLFLSLAPLLSAQGICSLHALLEQPSTTVLPAIIFTTARRGGSKRRARSAAGMKEGLDGGGRKRRAASSLPTSMDSLSLSSPCKAEPSSDEGEEDHPSPLEAGAGLLAAPGPFVTQFSGSGAAACSSSSFTTVLQRPCRPCKISKVRKQEEKGEKNPGNQW